jgi:hypothetical protein
MVVYSAEPGTPDHDAIVLLDMKGAGALDGTSITSAGDSVLEAEPSPER